MNDLILVKVYFEDLEQLRVLLSPPNLGFVPWEKMQRTFSGNQQYFDDAYIGFALRTEEEYVGFIGLLRTIRLIDGKETEVVNLTSFVVLEAYRGHGPKLVRKIKELTNNALFTIITPIHITQRLFERIHNARIQSSRYYVLGKSPTPQGSHPATLERNYDRIQTLLHGEPLRVFYDHRHEDCMAICLEDEHSTLLLLLKLVELEGRCFLEILYYSDRQRFLHCLSCLSDTLSVVCEFNAVIIDEFDVPQEVLEDGRYMDMPLPRMVFGGNEGVSNVPFMCLYSERTKMNL